jgi:hypothetical protein
VSSDVFHVSNLLSCEDFSAVKEAGNAEETPDRSTPTAGTTQMIKQKKYPARAFLNNFSRSRNAGKHKNSSSRGVAKAAEKGK